MTNESLTATVTIKAPAETVFAIIADPASHAAIDGTGWVRESRDGNNQLSTAEQVFRIAIYHPNHPNGNYEMANKIVVFDPPFAIAWKPGQDLAGTGELEFGGGVWGYELTGIRHSGPRRQLLM